MRGSIAFVIVIMLSGCGPKLNVTLNTDGANIDAAGFSADGGYSNGETQDGEPVFAPWIFAFDWHDKTNADFSSTMWAYRVINISLLDGDLAVRAFDIGRDEAKLSLGFNPEPNDDETELEWGAVSGAVVVSSIDEHEIALRIDARLETASGDADGSVDLHADGAITRA